MRTSPSRLAIVAIAALALGTAGCGASTGDDAAPGSTAPTTLGSTTATPTTTAPSTSAPATTAANPSTPSTTAPSGGDAAPWVDGTIATTATTCSGSMGGRAMVYPPTLVVVDAATGTLRWQFCPSVPTSGIGAAIAGDTVVFSSGVLRADGQIEIGIAGFDAATGATRWQTRRPTGLATVVNDDIVILPPLTTTPTAQETTAVAAATGERRWHLDGVSVATNDIVGVGAGDTVIGHAGASIVGLDARDGSERWRTEGVAVRIVTAGGAVGSSSTGAASQVAVIDLTSGQVRWKADGALQFATDQVVVVEAVDTSLPAATVPGTTGAPVTLPNVVQVRAIADGHVLWTFERSKAATDLRAFDGQGVPSDRLLLSTDNLGIEVHDARTGTLAWSRPGPVGVVLADDDTMITGDGIAAFDTETGNERWRFAIPCITDRTGCTSESSYVQTTALHNGLVALAVNDFGGG